jgi:hypothetical protein
MTGQEWETELIKAYVPEAEYLTWDEALELARERDDLAAEQFKLSIVEE